MCWESALTFGTEQEFLVAHMDMEDVNSYKGSPTSAKSASDLNWDAAEGRWQLPSASRCRRGPGGGGGGGAAAA